MDHSYLPTYCLPALLLYLAFCGFLIERSLHTLDFWLVVLFLPLPCAALRKILFIYVVDLYTFYT